MWSTQKSPTFRKLAAKAAFFLPSTPSMQLKKLEKQNDVK
ncbi:hypothetical protein UMNK88_3312 [Escherichia coli UMNK88]|nr:hypothetical protein UMNK88_3312 [Escherichia coli UMNK88]